MSNTTEMASEPGVGTRKLFENDKVIVWDFVLPVGAETPVHTHDHSYMWFAVQGAPLQIYDEHGNDVGLFQLQSPSSLFKPATRMRDSIPLGATATIVGFGLTGNGLTGSQTGTQGTKRAGQNVVDVATYTAMEEALQ